MFAATSVAVWAEIKETGEIPFMTNDFREQHFEHIHRAVLCRVAVVQRCLWGLPLDQLIRDPDERQTFD